MGKFLNATKKDLDKAVEDIERDVRKVLVNAVEVAQDVSSERVDTGFMVNNWYFSKNEPRGAELKNTGQSFSSQAGLTLRNITNWKLGENAFIVNNTEYASFHDLGTVYLTPLFISFQVQAYAERELRKIK